MNVSLSDIRRILNPQKHQAAESTLKILDSWSEYDDRKGVTNERPLEYLCYEMESIDPETGERFHFYKALKFARVIRLPKGAKQSTALMSMHGQVLSAVYEQNYNFVTVIANVREPVALGLLFLYGVQGVASSIAEAKEKAHTAFGSLMAVMQGTYRVLEMRIINAQETEWLREKLYSMDYLTVVRGIPRASETGEDAGNKGMGGKNLNPESEGTLEEIITGMTDYEYVIQILTSPVYQSTLRDWAATTRRDMTDWQSQMQGTKSFSLNLSIPMMYAANQGTSQGVNKGYTSAESINFSQGESFNTSYGENVGQALSRSYGQSFGRAFGQSFSESISQTHTISQGVSAGHTTGVSFGTSQGQTLGQSSSESQSQAQSESLSHSTGQSFSESSGQSSGQSFSENTGTSHGTSSGLSFGQSTGQNMSQSTGQNVGQTFGQSQSNGHSSSSGQSFGESFGQSSTIGQSLGSSSNVSRGTNTSTSFGQTTGESVGYSSGQSHSVSSGTSTSQGHSAGTSQSQSMGTSESTSRGVSESTGTSQTFGQSTSSGWSQSESASQSHSTGSSQSYGYNESTSQSSSESVSANQTASKGGASGGNVSLFGIGINGTQNQTDSNGAGWSAGTTEGSSVGYSQSSGTSESISTSHSASSGLSGSVGQSESLGQSASQSASMSTSNGTSESVSHGTSESFSDTFGKSMSESFGTSTSSSNSESISSSTSQSQGESYSEGTGYSASSSESTGTSYGQNSGQSFSQSDSSTYSESIGQSYGQNVSQSTGTSYGQSSGQNYGENFGESYGRSSGQNIGTSYSQSTGQTTGQSTGQSLGQSLGVSQGYSLGASASRSQSQSESQSYTVSQSESWSTSHGYTKGQSYTESVGENTSTGETDSYGQSKSIGQGQSTSTGRGTSESKSLAYSSGLTQGSSSSMGLSPSVGYSKSYQWLDQQVKDIVEMLEFQNERLKNALRGNGAFYTYVYIACPSLDALSSAKALAKSTWQNSEAMINPLQVLNLSDDEQQSLLTHCMGFSADVSMQMVGGLKEYKYCSVLLPKELVSYTHLPRISEGGLFVEVGDVPKFSVPSMLKGEVYMGTVLSAERYTLHHGYRTPFDYRIDERELMHMFVTGASRSGKTVAAMRFVAELTRVRRKRTGKRLRIVCMDPKQDWRSLAKYVEPERFKFYNMGNTLFRPIHLNPLKIPHGVNPQFWIDGVIDIYCRAYGLLERGKQMLGETIYQLYHEAGVFGYTEDQKQHLTGKYKQEYMLEHGISTSDENGMAQALEYANDRICQENEDIKKNRCPERISEMSSHITFASVYDRMNLIKLSMEGEKEAEEQLFKLTGQRSKGKSGNDTKDAYARLLDRLQAFNREFSVERQLFGTEDGMSVDELIGADDVTVLESKGLENTFRNFIFGVITSGFYKFALAHEGGFLADDQYETLLVIEEANEVLTGSDVAGTGGGASFGMTGQSEFEQILDQSAGYGLFIMAITQKISDMPKSIIANSGLVFAGRLKTPDDITTVIQAIAREDKFEDRDLVKWFPRSPTGWFVCMSSRTFDFKDSEPVLVQISPLNLKAPSNAEIDELMTDRAANIYLNAQSAHIS